MTRSHTGAVPMPSAFDEDTSEHILLEGDDRAERGDSLPRTKSLGVELRDGLRGTRTTLVLYAEGFANFAESGRCGNEAGPHRLDLRYLDPVPAIDKHMALNSLYAALALAGTTAVLVLVARIDAAAAIAASAALVGALGTLVALFTFFYRSHEKITFVTLHGRAPVLTLKAGLGYAGRVRGVLPALSSAIEDAVEGLGDDPKTHLRREMREHYRLREEGVLTQAACSDGTGRILAQFDTDF